jgi:hypothetical protein
MRDEPTVMVDAGMHHSRQIADHAGFAGQI